MRNSKNVQKYIFGRGSIEKLYDILNERKKKSISGKKKYVIYYIDCFFENSDILEKLPLDSSDEIFFVSTKEEPTTNAINWFKNSLIDIDKTEPVAVVAIGGGATLDTGKAISNLLTNRGAAEDYQGWDLVKNKGVYKIGVPTISGTGAETSRTCVMTNHKNGLKLGMNSDYTIYDQLILDPDFLRTVPRNQYFYTGMDTYIHCIESLRGRYRNAIGDAFSEKAVTLCREIFLSNDMMSEKNQEKMMVASYLGGCAIANSFLGIVHPFSAGLSVVLHTHHCIGNCITMNSMKEFYPDEYKEYVQMANKQNIKIPKGVAKNLSDAQYKKLYKSTVIHEKPLSNALGEKFSDILNFNKVINIFKEM